MGNKKIVLVLILVFVLLIGGATVLYQQLGEKVDTDQLAEKEPQLPSESEQPEASDAGEPPEEEPVQAIKAPDFTVYDAGGNEVHLSDYFGKPIVLNFWASWCGPCQMEMPAFQEKYLELGDEIQFLMINSTGGRESLESAMEFIDKKGYTFPVFYDTETDAAYTYGAFSLPVTFFIDADGYAVAQASGAVDSEILQHGIDMIK